MADGIDILIAEGDAIGVRIEDERAADKSSTIIKEIAMASLINGLPPIHPGEMLADELNELGMSEDFWRRLQTTYDIKKAKAESGAKIASDVSPLGVVGDART